MDRAKVIFSHLNKPRDSAEDTFAEGFCFSPTAAESDDDVVICSALRTPICKARRGGFKDTLPDDLLSAAFTGIINDAAVDPTIVQDICVGNVGQPGAGANIARIAQFFSNIPETVPISTTNRMCSSGLDACAKIAASIKAGYIDVGIGAGVESMSLNGMGKRSGMVKNPRLKENLLAYNSMLPMGMTAEIVAERFNVTREKQDQFSTESHAKAARAQTEGRFDSQIIPVRTKLVDKDGNETPIIISKDDGVRPSTTVESLGKLKPVFKTDGTGTVTAGNASQVSDGAAAVLLAKRSVAKRYGLPIIGVFKAYVTVGVLPEVMGVGPAYAIPELLRRTGMSRDQIDIYEINEAFASQAAYCVEKLGIPKEKVNPNGGAVAIGHPLGCTGARMVATVLHELKRRGQKGSHGVVSMCMGTGMGAAALIQYTG